MKNNKLKKKSIIIDTDPGYDDALAIMFLEKSKRFDIEAITTVCGNSNIENVSNNAFFIRNLINSKTPIFVGASKPLKRKLVKADVHGESGLGGMNVKKVFIEKEEAADKIIEIVRNNPNQVTILLLSPQTNLAKAFLQDKALPNLIKEVVIMGGAICTAGNKNRVAEFNIFVDPEAADIVFRSSVKKTLIPLDLCNKVYLKSGDLNKIKKTEFYQEIFLMIKSYIEGTEIFERERKAIMYDPLAAYYLIRPDLFKTQEMNILIETKGEITRRMTVAERRKWGSKRNKVNVAVSVNRQFFVNDFFKILNKREINSFQSCFRCSVKKNCGFSVFC